MMMAAVAVAEAERAPALPSLLSSDDDDDDARDRAGARSGGAFSLFASRRMSRMVGVDEQLALSDRHMVKPLPRVELETLTRVFFACADVTVGTPNAEQAFTLTLPSDLDALTAGTPYRVMVDQLELHEYSCDKPHASCYLRIARALELAPRSHALTITRTIPTAPPRGAQPQFQFQGGGQAALTPVPSSRASEVSCYLPFGHHTQFNPPALLFKRIVSLSDQNRQREFRYSAFAAAHDMLTPLQFTRDGRLGAQSLTIHGAEPLLLTLYRCNPDLALSSEDRAHANPRREHFNYVLDGAKKGYFDTQRTLLFYACQLGGSVVADLECKVKFRFQVHVTYSVRKDAAAAPAKN
jgi:hypothetical protein